MLYFRPLKTVTLELTSAPSERLRDLLAGEDKPNTDEVALSWHLAKTVGYNIPERTFRHGLRQLLERAFLFESLVDGVYYVNIRYMFNGDRLTFIKGYKLEGVAKQEQLVLETPIIENEDA